MTSKTHSLGGLAAAGAVVLACQVTSPLVICASALTGTLGGLFPDIDHPKSKISGKMRVTSLLYRICAVVGKTAGMKDMEHRGIMHTLLPLVPFLVLALVFLKSATGVVILSFCAGYLSHLLLDSCNPGGVLWLFPVKRKKYRILPKSLCVKTGSLRELLFTLFAAVLTYFAWRTPALLLIQTVALEAERLAGR